MFIFSAVLSNVTLHQPGFRMVWIDTENSVEENLRDIPTFFRHRTGSVRAIDTNVRVITAEDWS